METKFKSKKLLLKSQSGHTENSKTNSKTQKRTQKHRNLLRMLRLKFTTTNVSVCLDYSNLSESDNTLSTYLPRFLVVWVI